MTLQQERRDGYDIRIEPPAGYSGTSHAVFLQFKEGTFRKHILNWPGRFGGTKRSIFSSRSVHNPVLVFEINNNKYLDQHIRLRATASVSTDPGEAVYALPRIRDLPDLKRWLGDLLVRTTFLGLDDVDRSASSPILAGKKHHIHCSYSNGLMWEVCSEPAHPAKPEAISGKLIGELTALRIRRSVMSWAPAVRSARADRSTQELSAAICDRLVFECANLLGSTQDAVTQCGFPTSSKFSNMQDLLMQRQKTLDEKLLHSAIELDGESSSKISPKEVGEIGRHGSAETLREIAKIAIPSLEFIASGSWLEKDNPPEVDTRFGVSVPEEGMTLQRLVEPHEGKRSGVSPRLSYILV
ncbi:MAG TPA: hypothetical protein VJV39_01210 [Dongiaceae bacterium]|nr:hypothetical protein [Dongiaceae bacterium]